MRKLPFQKRYKGTKWSLLCGALCVLAAASRLVVQYINQYTALPGAFNLLLTLVLLFLGYRFFRQYYCYLRLNNEKLIISRVLKDRKIDLPDIDQMSLERDTKNAIYLLMDDGTEFKINLLDLNENSREEFRKTFYKKN